MIKYTSLLFFSSLVTTMALAQPVPIVEYRFIADESLQPSTGIANYNGARLAVRDANNIGVALVSETGVSGLPGDYALDFTSAPGPVNGLGSDGNGPFARTESDASLPDIDGLASMTLQGWYKTDLENVGNGWYIFNNSDINGGGYAITVVNDGEFRLFVNGGNTIARNRAWNITGEWAFFAVTYDGLATENNVSFYVGKIDQPVTLVLTQTLNKGVINDDTNRLFVSNQGRPFKGLFDNLRIYGSLADSSGVLTLEQLESVRLGDGGVEVATKWAGFDIVDGYVDTGSWLEWMYVANTPWVYIVNLSEWVYLSEAAMAAEGGSWMWTFAEWAGAGIVDGYVDTTSWLGWLYIAEAPWVYSLDLGHWMFLSDDSGAPGSWIYIPG